MKWEKKEIDPQEVRRIAKEFRVDLLIAAILVRREILQPREICFYLENDVRFLHNPFLFQHMVTTVQRINQAIELEEKITIFGDRDVDGMTSTVLLFENLQELGADVNWMLPEGEDEYGLTLDVVDKISENGTQLLIAVDCGITNVAEVEQARVNGIEVIIIDHHNPPPDLPNAVAVVDPKVADSGYPFKDLSGCGVVLKVVWALLFSRTSFFNQEICLMNIRPGNESFFVEAVKLVNLVETERVFENIVPGMIPFHKTRLQKLFLDSEAVVLDADLQQRLFVRAFGSQETLVVTDLEPLIRTYFPKIVGKSLVKLKKESVVAQYTGKPVAEIDVLCSLFTSLVLKKEQTVYRRVLESLDLVALSTLADLMPLVDENRILVSRGLEILNKLKRDGLRELVLKRDLIGKQLRAKEIGWEICPILNAAGRMGVPNKATQLLLSRSYEEATFLGDELIALNKKRRDKGSTEWSRILPQAREMFEETDRKIVYVSDNKILHGNTGILATRLMHNFHVPSVVVAVLEKRAVGSLRSPVNIPTGSLLGQCSDILVSYGGHDCAAGFSLLVQHLADLRSRLLHAAQSFDFASSEKPDITIDAEIPLEYLTLRLKDVLDVFEPFGEGNPPLVFRSCGLRICNCEIVGSNHLKLLLDSGKLKWPAIYWQGAESFGSRFQIGDHADAIYRLTYNYFQNVENLQMTILDLHT